MAGPQPDYAVRFGGAWGLILTIDQIGQWDTNTFRYETHHMQYLTESAAILAESVKACLWLFRGFRRLL